MELRRLSLAQVITSFWLYCIATAFMAHLLACLYRIIVRIGREKRKGRGNDVYVSCILRMLNHASLRCVCRYIYQWYLVTYSFNSNLVLWIEAFTVVSNVIEKSAFCVPRRPSFGQLVSVDILGLWGYRTAYRVQSSEFWLYSHCYDRINNVMTLL